MSRIIGQCRYILKCMGDQRIDKLTPQKYNQFKNELNQLISKGKPLSSTYKNKIHQAVCNMMVYSRRFHNIGNDSPSICGGFKSEALIKEQDFYTYEEYLLFKSNVDHVVWKAFFDLLYYCGVRYGEANALTWDDIDLGENEVSITKTLTTKIKGVKWHISTPKTKASVRTLPLPKQVKSSLMELKAYYKTYEGFDDSWFIFGGVRALVETTVQNVKNKLGKKADLKQIRLHDFRHSCASLLINHGANITLVAKYLGHSKIDVTLNTYSHMYKSKLDEVVEMINDL